MSEIRPVHKIKITQDNINKIQVLLEQSANLADACSRLVRTCDVFSISDHMADINKQLAEFDKLLFTTQLEKEVVNEG